MAQLFRKIEEGDLSECPLDRYAAAQIVRVRLVKGPEQILDKFRELQVRSWVVRQLAHLYIERHVEDLHSRPGVLKIHGFMQQATVEASLKEHVAVLFVCVVFDRRFGFWVSSSTNLTPVGRSPPSKEPPDAQICFGFHCRPPRGHSQLARACPPRDGTAHPTNALWKFTCLLCV